MRVRIILLSLFALWVSFELIRASDAALAPASENLPEVRELGVGFLQSQLDTKKIENKFYFC